MPPALVLGQDDLGRQAGSIDYLLYDVVQEGSDRTLRLRRAARCVVAHRYLTLSALEYGPSVTDSVPETNLTGRSPVPAQD